MSFLTAHEDIQTKFRTDVEVAEAVKVVYDDAEDPHLDTNDLWVRFTILLGESLQVDTGTDTNRDRTVGIGVAQIFVRIEKGTRIALQLADVIRTAFRQKTVDGIVYQTPSLTNVGRRGSSKWWQLNVSCPFRFDTAS